MIAIGLVLLVVIGLSLLALAFLLPVQIGRSEASYCAKERAYMPPEVAGGRLVLSEETIRAKRVAKIVAKPDQVYLSTNDALVLVENKTRERNVVYDSDRVELSVQAFALRHGRGETLKRYSVADYGYVAVRVGNRPPVFHRVVLLTDEAIVSLRQRRLALVAGLAEPGGPPSIRVCGTCGQRPNCPRAQRQAG